jgi:protein-disulfide isomerase
MWTRWAIALSIAPALLGCGGTHATAESPAVAPGEQPAGPGGFEVIPIEEFAKRVDRQVIPAANAERPSRGPVGAPVTIHVFSDFECPFCAQAEPVLRAVEAEFSGSVRVVWHDFPLPGHAHAETAAVAGDLVYRTRGGAAFWRYHDAVFRAAQSGLDDETIVRLANREGVDRASLNAALMTGAGGRIAAELKLGDDVGVEGTPAFLVNDWMVTGVVPYSAFRALVARALAEAKN